MHRESKISVGSIVFSLNFFDVMWKPTIEPFGAGLIISTKFEEGLDREGVLVQFSEDDGIV